jgi:hypothetical protein
MSQIPHFRAVVKDPFSEIKMASLPCTSNKATSLFVTGSRGSGAAIWLGLTLIQTF